MHLVEVHTVVVATKGVMVVGAGAKGRKRLAIRGEGKGPLETTWVVMIGEVVVTVVVAMVMMAIAVALKLKY
jgi:hypothetical protein